MSHTSLAVRWIAYISQDETTEVPQKFREQNWLKIQDNSPNLFRHTPLAQWIVSKKSPIPQYLMYDGWQYTESNIHELPIHLWIQYRQGQSIPFDVFTEKTIIERCLGPNNDTLLQYWLQYRKNEPIPPELLYNTWWNPQEYLHTQLIAPTLFTWIQYCQGQAEPPRELLYPIVNYKDNSVTDYRIYQHCGKTPLQVWIMYRPGESVPNYLDYQGWEQDYENLTLWLIYRPNEPLPQLMYEFLENQLNIVNIDEHSYALQVPNIIDTYINNYNITLKPIMGFIERNIKNSLNYDTSMLITQWIKYKKHKDLPAALISLIEPQQRWYYISQWIMYRPTESIPSYLMYDGFVEDYHKIANSDNESQIVEKWIENRPHEPVPEFLYPLISSTVLCQRIKLLERWLICRADEPIPDYLKFDEWNTGLSANYLINKCIDRQGPFSVPEELLQSQTFMFSQSPKLQAPCHHWLQKRPFEPVPEFFMYPGCQYGYTYIWVEAIMQYVKEIYNGYQPTIIDGITITADSALNCLRNIPDVMKYPGWNTEPHEKPISGMLYTANTPIVNFVQVNLLSSYDLEIPDDYIYTGCLKHILNNFKQLYQTEKLDLQKLFQAPNNIIAANLYITNTHTDGNCCICYTDSSDKPLLRMCNNSHTENLICEECYIKLYCSKNKRCPLCQRQTLIDYTI